jgi:hypothetical protein
LIKVNKFDQYIFFYNCCNDFNININTIVFENIVYLYSIGNPSLGNYNIYRLSYFGSSTDLTLNEYSSDWYLYTNSSLSKYQMSVKAIMPPGKKRKNFK